MTCRLTLFLAALSLGACEPVETEPPPALDPDPVETTEEVTEPTPEPEPEPVSLIAGYQILTETDDHPGATSTCITSTCPEGQVALGGGGFWPESIALDNNRPLDVDQWGLCGYAEAAAEWTVSAVCVDDTPELAYELVTVQDTAPGLTSTCVVATCPEGKKVVGGGGYFDHPINLDNIRPFDEQSFSVCGYAAQDAAYWAQAVCADIPDEDYELVTEIGQHPGATSACVAATCPDGFKAVGGGGRWEIGKGMEPDNSGVNPSQWVVCGYSDEPSEVWAQAICVRE